MRNGEQFVKKLSILYVSRNFCVKVLSATKLVLSSKSINPNFCLHIHFKKHCMTKSPSLMHLQKQKRNIMQPFPLRPLDRPVDMKTVPVRVVAAVVPRAHDPSERLAAPRHRREGAVAASRSEA